MRLNSTLPVSSISALLCVVLLAACWPQADPAPVRVRMLYNLGGKGDRGWNDTSYAALHNAREVGDTVFIEAQPLDLEEAATHFFQWLADSTESYRELIVANSGKYAALVEQGECNFGQRKVVLFEGSVTGCAAVKTVNYQSYAAAFVAGATAARASRTGYVGVISEAGSPEFQALASGFCAGAQYVATSESQFAATQCFSHYIPTQLTGVADTPVRQAWAHNYEVIKWAEFYYEHKDVDIIFGATERDNTALFDVAEAVQGRYAVGLDADQSGLAPSVVIGSVVRRTDLTLQRIINDFDMVVFASGPSSIGYKCHPEKPVECSHSSDCGPHRGCSDGVCANELDYVVSSSLDSLTGDWSDKAMDVLKTRNKDDENAALAAAAEFYGSGASQCD